MLKDWASAARARICGRSTRAADGALGSLPGRRATVLAPPAIDGLGISSGFQMQIELLDGSNDFRKLGDATQALVRAARADPRIQFAFTSLRTSNT